MQQLTGHKNTSQTSCGSADEEPAADGPVDPTTDECDPPAEAVTTSEAPTTDALEEGAADDAPAPAGAVIADDQDESELDATTPDDQAEPRVSRPGGVAEADVEAAVDEHDRLGDVADELGVTRGRGRTITVALGWYGDLRDGPARRGGA